MFGYLDIFLIIDIFIIKVFPVMYERDYILRMIEMIGEFIAAIMGLIKEGEYDKAEEKLSDLYYTALKEDAAFFRVIPEEKLTDSLLQQHNYTHGHLEILAELFNTEAELAFARGNTKGSYEYSKKALILFEFVEREDRTWSLEKSKKIQALKDRILELSGKVR